MAKNFLKKHMPVLVPTSVSGKYLDMTAYHKDLVKFVGKEFFLLWAMTGIIAYLTDKEIVDLKDRVRVLEAKAVLNDIKEKVEEKNNKEE